MQRRIYSWRGPCSEKNVGPLIYECPLLPDCLHLTRTVVIIDIFLRHSTQWGNELLLQHEIIFCAFVGAPFLWGPLFSRTCWTCLNRPLVSCLIGWWWPTLAHFVYVVHFIFVEVLDWRNPPTTSTVYLESEIKTLLNVSAGIQQKLASVTSHLIVTFYR